MTIDEASNRRFISKHHLEDIPYIVSKDLAVKYNIIAPPYGLIIDEQGKLKAKGLINHLEHLESLLEAAQSSHPTMEDWAKAQHTKRSVKTINAQA